MLILAITLALGIQGSNMAGAVEKLAEKVQKPSVDPLTVEYIKSNEGYRDSVYKDTKGKKTIGYGFNIDDETVRSMVHPDVVQGKRKITQQESDEIITKLIERASKDAQTYVGKDTFGKLSATQKLALTDMAYNIGLSSLNNFNNMRAGLVKGDKLKAKMELLNSKYAREDVPARALKNSLLMEK